MSKTFWGFLLVGLAVAGAIVAIFWGATKSAHLAVDGKILKVRSIPLGGDAALVAVDFRISNTSGVPLVVNGVSMKMLRYKEEPLDGLQVSKTDVDVMFQSHPLLGVKYNDVLGAPDHLAGGKTVDRMAEARFEASEAAVESRKGIVLHIDDVDGAGFDIAENR